MTDEELHALHQDPAHWRAGVLYVCARDPRVIVPKRLTSMGWTFNWAHPAAIPMLLMFVILAVGPAALVLRFGDAAPRIPRTVQLMLALGFSIVVITLLASSMARSRHHAP